MKKRVLVLYTGGTLGMQKTAQGFRPVPNWFEAKLRALPELSAPEMPDFCLMEYSPLLDSSDIRPEHWLRIAQDILAQYDKYDGFVVLHGTDTLAYSASAVHYLLADLTKPVIFTGAQIPLSEPQSDSLFNVRNALYCAAYSAYHGVGLLFANSLLKAEYASKFAAQDLDGFASFNAQPILSWQGDWLSLPEPSQQEHKTPRLRQLNHKKVAVLTFFPGMDFQAYAGFFAAPWDVVILHSFGSGNIPQHPDLWQALRELAARGVTLINCTQCKKGLVEQKYASGYLMAEIGVVFAGDKTLESTLAWAQITRP